MNQQNHQDPMSFASILKFIHLKKRSGVLKVKTAEEQLDIHFREGRIINVDIAKGQEWIIGEYLLEGEAISERKLLKSLRLAEERRVSPETILVEKKYVSPDVIKRYMDLYSREVVLPLFGRVGLACSFINEDSRENPWLPPVSVPYLLKEGERRAREWPLLSKRIPSVNVVYDKDKSFISQVMKEGADTDNPLFSSRVDPELGANERMVYYFVDGKRIVKQIARAAGLDLFSTCKALYTLENKFMVKVLSTEGQESRREKTLAPYFLKALYYGTIILALVGLAVNRPGPLKILAGEREVDMAQVKIAKERVETGAVHSALEVLMLTDFMDCPASLGRAVDEGLMPEELPAQYELTCEKGLGYTLRRIEQAE